MAKAHRSKIMILGLAALFMLMFAASGIAETGRIVPTDKVTLHDSGKVIGEYTKEAPLPFDTLLTCKGDCAVKMNALYLVAKDKSAFAISAAPESRNMIIKDGMVYFVLSELPKTLTFATPAGSITVQQAIVTAAAEKPVIKGYVSPSELGVIEGGSLLVSTKNGEQMIESGNRIILSQEEDEDTVNPLAIGLVVGSTIVLPQVLEKGVSSASDDDGSPSVP